MKRKHGHKKGKSKKHRVEGSDEPSKPSASVEVEDNSDTDDNESDEPESAETPVAAEPSPSTVPDQPTKVAAAAIPEKPIQKPVTHAVYGRVKVRLKAPKPLEPQVNVVDVPIHSDTHSSSGLQKSLDKREVVLDKIEDSANSLRDVGTTTAEKLSGKLENVVVKSSKSMVPSSSNQKDEVVVVAQKEEKSKSEEPKLPNQEPQYNKKELDAALEVIKKVMKMDAAEPFNVPVNPVELGIPDYFDVIDTPMDFGTVRKNLESGNKYMNSESVYKDVRYIWENCYKYNNKGDYIVDLMRRVKKNFMKYWAASGLYSDQPKKGHGVEGNHGSDGGSSSQDKKLKKGKGFKKHKDGCLCAICIMKRRRKEREQREAQETREKGHDLPTMSGMSDPNLTQGVKSEENTPMENQGGEEISSSVENSQDADGDEEVEDFTEDMKSEAVAVLHNSARNTEDNKLDNHDTSMEDSVAPQVGNRAENGSFSMSDPKLTSNSGTATKADNEKQPPVYIEAHTSTLQKRKIELIEAEKKRQKAQLYESLKELETKTLAGLCNTLFSENRNSVWVGPHSLLHQKTPPTNNGGGVLAAVSSFMSPPPKRACK